MKVFFFLLTKDCTDITNVFAFVCVQQTKIMRLSFVHHSPEVNEASGFTRELYLIISGQVALGRFTVTKLIRLLDVTKTIPVGF